MNRDEIKGLLKKLAERNNWRSWQVDYKEDGRIFFELERGDGIEEIAFDNYKKFTDFVLLIDSKMQKQ